MTIFYWVMGVLIVGTLVPSALFLLLYALTGEDGVLRRARAFFTYVLTLIHCRPIKSFIRFYVLPQIPYGQI